jgi:hypothetical protein
MVSPARIWVFRAVIRMARRKTCIVTSGGRTTSQRGLDLYRGSLAESCTCVLHQRLFLSHSVSIFEYVLWPEGRLVGLVVRPDGPWCDTMVTGCAEGELLCPSAIWTTGGDKGDGAHL